MKTKSWLLLISVITALCYSNIYDNEFLFDDLPAITENEATEQPVSLSKIFFTPSWWSEKDYGTLKGYRPLTTLSFSINRAIHGVSVGGYHFGNIVIHIANSLVIYFIILILFNRTLLAGITSLLFATHPLHTEAVTGIVARADLLAAFFVLLALWSYIKAWQLNLPKGFFLFLLSCLCLLSGLASKESAACFFLLVIAYEICFNFFSLKKIAETDKKIITAKTVVLAFFILLTLGYIFWWRPFITGQFGDLVIGEGARPPGLLYNLPVIWRLTAFKAFAYYMKLLFWPATLSGDYLFNQIPLTNQIRDPLVLGGLTLFVGFLGLGTWALVKGYIGIAFGIFFLYAAYIPVSNLVVPIGALVGERLFYLPSLGFCIVIAVFFDKLFNQLRSKYTAKLAVAVLTSVLAVVTICYGSRAFARNFDWENPYAFFKKTSATSPNSAVSHYSAAVAYLMMIQDNRYIKSWMKPQEIQNLRAQSDKGKALLIENGLNSISTALNITKEYPNVKYLNVYGALLATAGKLEQAMDVLVHVVDKVPDLVEANITLGVICMRLASKPEKRAFTSSRMAKDYMAKSLRYLQEAERQKTRLTGNPKRIAELYFNLSIVEQKLGRLYKATEDINDALFWLNKTMEKTGQGKFLFGRFYVIKAGILAEKRDFEGAVAALAKAKEAGFPQFRRYVLRMKQLRPLHEHPGFRELIDGDGTY